MICYFYFDFKETEKHSSKKSMRSLLFHLAHQQSRLQILEQLYQRCGNGQQQPTENVIRSLLEDVIVCIGHKYIVFDALDECVDREDFMTFISELVHSQTEDLHIMITSRREKDIEDQLGPIANYRINIQNAIVDDDIRMYVHDRLVTDRKLGKWPERVQGEIIMTIMKKADGMYIRSLIAYV